MAKPFGVTPRVALVSHSTFGNPKMERSEKMRDAVTMLDRREDVDFEYDGEMNVDVALNPDLMRELYPFSRLSDAGQRAGHAGAPLRLDLDQPARHRGRRDGDRPSAHGPGQANPDRPARRTVSDIVTYATLAAFQVAELKGEAKA
jgi:malate dehydrogenase (oxaloacetate-decarboxylating)(NADP+)